MSIFIDSCARGVTREATSQIVKNFNIEEIYVLFYDKNVEPEEIATCIEWMMDSLFFQ